MLNKTARLFTAKAKAPDEPVSSGAFSRDTDPHR
jgi:hypothetical protein